MNCPLCQLNPKDVIWENASFAVIDARQNDIPGYVRLVAKQHLAEMTDFSLSDQKKIWELLSCIEKVMRQTMHPQKVNLAEFGNMVPHLHWHIIPRYKQDAWFPESVWAPKIREVSRETLEKNQQLALQFFKELKTALSGS